MFVLVNTFTVLNIGGNSVYLLYVHGFSLWLDIVFDVENIVTTQMIIVHYIIR